MTSLVVIARSEVRLGGRQSRSPPPPSVTTNPGGWIVGSPEPRVREPRGTARGKSDNDNDGMMWVTLDKIDTNYYTKYTFSFKMYTNYEND